MNTETAYHRALRWYPASWHEQHAAAVLGTLLDQADAEQRSTPTVSERIDLATHGLHERARRLSAVSAGVRDRASAIALATGAMFSVVMIGLAELNAVAPTGVYLPAGNTFGPFASPAIVVYAAWIAAWALSVIGRERVGRFLLAATIPLAVVVRIASDANGMWLRPSWTTMGFLILLALVAIPGAPGRTTRGAGWLSIAAAVALAVFVSPLLLVRHTVNYPDYVFGIWPIDGVVGGVPWAALVLAIALRLSGQRAWSGATLLAAVPWVLLVLFGGRDTEDIVATTVLAGVAAATLVLLVALLRVFGLRVHVTTTKN